MKITMLPATARARAEDRNRGETGVLAQHPQAEADVLEQGFDKACVLCSATFLTDVLEIAKPKARLARSLLRRHARGSVLRRFSSLRFQSERIFKDRVRKAFMVRRGA